MENQLKELRNFTDLDFSKGKALSCIDWHPTKKGVVAVSVCKTMSFDERVEVSGQVDVAYVIIWEFAEWIKPQLALQSPQECFSFKYNPTMPNIVVGGCYSGQAIMWDLNEAMADIEKKKLEKKIDKNGEDEEEVSLSCHCMYSSWQLVSNPSNSKLKLKLKLKIATTARSAHCHELHRRQPQEDGRRHHLAPARLPDQP